MVAFQRDVVFSARQGFNSFIKCVSTCEDLYGTKILNRLASIVNVYAVLHISDILTIKFCMFKDEIKDKFGIKSTVFPYVVTVTSGKTVISGVKKVLSAKEDEIAISVSSCVVRVSGKGLEIVEIGGGDAYVKGEIYGVNFEK